MFKKIIGTGLTRGLNAVSSLVTLMLASKLVGAREWGIDVLVQTDVTLMLIGVELLAGSGLVYFTPRKKVSTLLTVSFSWIFLVMAFYALLFWGLSFTPNFFHHIVPEGYAGITLLLVFIYSFHNFNMNILLGKERVNAANVAFMVQFLVQVSSFAIFIFCFNIRDAHAFVYSQLAGYVTGTIVGCSMILKYLKKEDLDPIRQTVKEMFNYGGIIQLSTLAHILNKRLSMFLLDSYCSKKDVGIYGSGVQVSEGVKLIGHSISLVQFSKLSNTEDGDVAARLTVRFMKLCLVLTIIALVIICVLPTSFYEWVLSKEFSQIKQVIVILSPGIVMLAANTIFSHYFSGTDKPKYNLFASLIGLSVTIPAVYLLVPRFGISGAAISASITYTVTVVYQWIVFHKVTGIRLSEFLLDKTDWTWAKDEFRILISKNKGVADGK